MAINPLETYQSAITRHFAFLKETQSLTDLYARSLPLADNAGLLVPVCELHADDGILVEKLADWRGRNQSAYPTRFPVTIEGTRNWMRKHLLDVPDRILFMVQDKHGHAIGHLGFANCLNDQCAAEIDNVVRGESGQAGLMSAAMSTLTDWMEEQFLAERIYLRVLADNSHAISFYQRLNFVESAREPLVTQTSAETTNLVPATQVPGVEPDHHFVVMDYAGNLQRQNALGNRMILTAGPSVSSRESSYAIDAARFGWNDQWSKYLGQFETEFAKRCGVKHAMATSSCTGAMHLSLLALGIGPGDEVIVPDLTWVATASAVCHVGATPIFADVDRQTVCIDPTSVEQLITANTKAIMPVHLYGHPAPMDRIRQIADHHHLRIVEDAAPSIGATYAGQPTGSFGDFGCFSFQGAKLLVTGEGGMLVTNDDVLFAKAKKIADHGRVPGTFWIDELGYKFKMSNLQAAFGLGQLERIDELVAAKRRIHDWYHEGLEGVPGITLLGEGPSAFSAHWMTSILVTEAAKLTRDELRERLLERKIDTRPIFPSISQYPIWPKKQAAQPHAERIGRQGINLPSGVCLRRAEVEYVCKTIRNLVSTTSIPVMSHELNTTSTIHTA